MLTISFTEISGKRRIKVALESGKFYTGQFESHRDFIQCANRLGMTEETIVDALNKFHKSGQLMLEVEPLLEVMPSVATGYIVRGEKSSLETTYPTFEQAFAAGESGDVIEWVGLEYVCCLDLDLTEQMDIERLFSLFSTINPIPVKFWISHSGQGIHAIYYAADPYTANELAAIGAYRFSSFCPSAKIELIHKTRVPPVCNSVEGSGSVQTTRFNIDGLLFSPGDDRELANAVCERYNFEIGKRYPHTQCPVHPSERGQRNTDPVVVHEDHVYCFICNADRRHYYHRSPGYFTFASLMDMKKETHLKHCIDKFTHWGHAQYVFHGAAATYKFSKLLYRGLLKSRHGADPRIPMAFKAGEPIGMVRYTGYWADYRGTPLDVKPGSARILDLPAANKTAVGTGESVKIVPHKSNAEWLTSVSDISSLGYKSIKPIHGFQMTQLQDLPDNKLFAVLPQVMLDDWRRPKLLASSERLDIEDAWREIEMVLPGLDRELVYALLIGKGCSEHRGGLAPMLFLTGFTGSGKSSHVEVAASICGDSVSKVKVNRDQSRFYNEVLMAKQRSGFVFFDEVFKVAKMQKIDPVSAMEPVLTMNESTMMYMIYKGSVALGELPMLVWADTTIDDEVLQHDQIGRRMYHKQLPKELSWEKTLTSSDILEPSKLRERGTKRLVLACDTILSDTVERYFTTPVTDFAIVKSLGFQLLRESSKNVEAVDNIKAIFEFICKAPLPLARDRVVGEGFKYVEMNDSNPIYQMFIEMQRPDERGTAKCRAIMEKDIRRLLILKYPCTMDAVIRSNKLYIRFISLDRKFINGQL